MSARDVQLERSSPHLQAQGRRWGEDGIELVLLVCAALSVTTTVGIIVAL